MNGKVILNFDNKFIPRNISVEVNRELIFQFQDTYIYKACILLNEVKYIFFDYLITGNADYTPYLFTHRQIAIRLFE